MNRVVFSSLSVEWATPPKIFGRLDDEFHFDLDPCPLTSGVAPGPGGNGLSPLFVPWAGRRVFCNPPYRSAEIRRWLERAPEATLAVYLLPARTDTRWFHELVLPLATEVRFLRGRLKFVGALNPAPFPSMVVVYAESPLAPAP